MPHQDPSSRKQYRKDSADYQTKKDIHADWDLSFHLWPRHYSHLTRGSIRELVGNSAPT